MSASAQTLDAMGVGCVCVCVCIVCSSLKAFILLLFVEKVFLLCTEKNNNRFVYLTQIQIHTQRKRDLLLTSVVVR